MQREAATAARWWADQLRKAQPSLADQMGAEPDNPMRGSMGAVLGVLSQAQDRVYDADAVERFAVELEQRLLASPPFGGFGTDYGPDALLRDAAEAAGIRVGMTTFPWKTVMWIKPGSVRVSAGYGVAPEEVPLTDAVA